MAGESHGYHHPLPHTPRELMRIVIDTFSFIKNTHRVEQLHRPVPFLLTIKAHMETYALRQLSPNLQDRIQRRHRICLLYTSDAADDLLCVDLGGRRIIKKK